MITFNQLHNLHLLVVGILVVYLFALVNSSGLSVRISPKKFTQYRGQYVVFHCYVTGNPVPIVTWYSKGKDITRDPRTEIGKVPGGYIMRLGPVHPFFDNGTLECRGKNGVDPLVSDKAELRVLLKPFAVLDPNLPPGIPKPLARYNPNLDVYVGANITLVVNVSGNPLPKITWFKGNRLLDWSNPRFTLLKNNSLRITNAQVADQGRYDYMAENDKGQIFPRPWNIGVDYIKTKPGFKPGLKNQVVDPETDIVLNCLATGYPKPDVLWKNSKNRTIQEDGFLRITSVRKSETYRCFAKNELGNATISVNVTLSGLPFAPRNLKRKSQTGYSLTVSWQDGEAGTKIDYHDINYRKIGDLYWRTVYDIPGNLREYRLDDLNAYTDYEVQVFARNKVGKSKGSKIISMMTDETAPGSAPHSIVVKSTETGSFEVSWLPPEYPNGRISFYTIYYSDEPHKSWETWPFTFATKSPRKISQIQNDRRYAVMISSSTGTSAAGPISEPFLVQTLQGAPSNPQNVQAKVISSTKVELTWKKPSYEGSGQGIVGYDIYYNTSLDGTRNKVTIQSPDDFSNVVTGLSPATIYKFDIAARTDAGSGPLSFPQFATTWEGAPSAPPNNFSCTAIDESHIHCSWRPPPRKDRNGLIIGYMIRCKLSNKDTSVKKSVNNSVLSMTLDKLQAYTVYHIDVAAKSSKGQGPFSDRIVVTTHETTPSKPPENMTATAINSTAIYVTWKAPTPPFGAKLTGYQFRYRKKPQEKAYTIIIITGNKRRILLTSLKPEQDYEFVIAAKSAKGTGRLTKPVVCKTKQAPPKPPVLVSKKLAAPQVGVALSWRSIARDIEQFQLRYAKDVEKITNETLLSKLTFVEKTFSSSVTAYNATNLGHGLWYVFKISVKNVGGWSTEREAWLLMDAAKPTGPPLNFRVEPKTSTSVQLSWDLPEKWKRNGKIIGYELSYLQVGSSTKRKSESHDDKRLFELQGLKKFTSYEFRILAKTVAGDGPTVSIEGMTKEDVPSDSPTLTDAAGMGTKVVRLKFKPPLTPNGRIIGYKVNIYLSNPTYAGKWRDDEMNENKNEMYVGKLLKPDSKYWFTVAAKTSVGYGPFSDPIFSKTLSYDLPLPVRKLSVDVTSSSTVKLQWDSPVDTAAVHSYKISYRSEKIFIGGDKKEAKIELPEEIKTVNCCKLNSASLENLEPCTEYTVEIVSVSKSERASESKKIKIKTKVASSPMFPQPNISRNGITEEYIPIYVHPASERYGPISHYLIYVASLGKTISEAREKLRDIRHSRSRRAVNTNGRDDVHIAGKLNASVVPTTFKVGRGQIKNGYTNRRLELGHFYAFSIRSCVLDENLLCLTTSTAFTDPVEFSDAEVAHTSGTGNEDTGNNLWLLGPVCAVLALIVVITVICLLWRRRARRREGKPNSLKEMVRDDQLPMMTSPRDPVEMQRLNLETEGMREHPPIHISDLGLHIEHLRSNNNNVFTREYESIDPGMTFTSEISAHHLNQSKNRYPNIVPYDHTRAVLEDTNGFQDSDYINANYLAGYRKPNAYIATQAPLTNTINDFWQMIWEQDTRTIVMMTNLQEKSRIKCDQYWPINQSSEKFGNISVVVLETVELAHYTVRTFRLCKDGQNDKSREMKQYQYTAWPDHGVPHYSTSLLCFIRKVRLANPSDAGPVIVHCSAGVGRTGVFIVIDSMLEKMRREQTVDVYGHVTLLRSQRNHMVQTEEQYIFIHETLLEAVLFGNTEIHASDLSQYYKKLNEIGVNETTSIEEHFKQLSVFCHTHRFVTPILAANKSKNRYPKIIPYEHSRVDLVPVRSVDGSNYINASYIDGYKQRRTYIAAQGPLEETVNDFWRMIMEKKSNIVVMLSGTDDNDQQMSATYWPSEKSAKYHFYIVDPVSVEETPNFTLRQFKVNDMMSSCPSLIKLFQLRKWPDRGKPQSYKAILDLIGQVHIARNNDETKGPVVVHCGSGSGRTGVFCALSIVVERMRAEGVVDLLQTVRQLREQRPQMVETLEEYAFCYEAALQYLSSFDHITA